MNVTYKIDDATQYATVYAVGTNTPVATLVRKRVMDRRSAPAWSMYTLDGKLVLRTWATERLATRVELFFGGKRLEDLPRHG